MTSSSLTEGSRPFRRPTLPAVLAALFGVAILALSGCLADTPEDSDLPWASNKNWEGIAPTAPSMMDRYE